MVRKKKAIICHFNHYWGDRKGVNNVIVRFYIKKEEV